MDKAFLTEARDRLLQRTVEYFSQKRAVVGIFLSGSLPAGEADAYSDIDLRVVVSPDQHERFVRDRLTMPSNWGDFLFNEWLEGTQHCLSHFRPFGKIDVFYISQADFGPSPWYGLPTEALYDPKGLIEEVLEKSKGLRFVVAKKDIERSLGKGLAATHEAYRRLHRRELFYAQSLLNELRCHVVQAEDWLQGRPPRAVVLARLEERASEALCDALKESYALLEANSMERALLGLAARFRDHIVRLHKHYELNRSLENDLYAVDIILGNANAAPPVS